MPGTARAMTWCTVVALVVVTAYSVAFGPNGWLWFSWTVLAMLTAAAVLSRRS